ncbi:DUF1764-domain-containing protein [Lentinula aciculospora]|uniref:DUF1764-domain-containing protein n=1 Tax=Lentinula aciculospora TaxID=153920 RepID=A0A9W9AMR4_9AGAR|nr:DUF1764-domain-containing protein [Lentinula aciculospora]
MAKSEIDDIFASKGKVQPTVIASTSSTKKDKKRKRKSESDAKDSAAADKPKRRPETIVDPSASMPTAKRVKISKFSEKAGTGKEKVSGKAKEEDRFKDSRGTGPRRKTEEGWSIYKADELGLKDDDEGGDTPLCPFDCDCCGSYIYLFSSIIFLTHLQGF